MKKSATKSKTNQTLVHSSQNVAKQIVDTANFIRNLMNRNTVLSIMDPETHQRITLMYPIEEWETNIENILCAYCAQEESGIHSVTYNDHNQMVVLVPQNKHAFKQNALYVYSCYNLEYLRDINP